MTRDARFGLAVIAVTVAVFTAHSTRGYLLVDACLDAGGRYVADPPRCEVGATARPLGDLRQRRGALALAIVPAALLGGCVYLVGRAALGRTGRAR
ncbi:hypothetical protein [Roseisolibacter sp. H3M3-2]|uniref:hypothetical protein n=1 Tax=Roseisolibacter sp. H3M3-2 TaxID=3031323 RepID=UPI0023DA039F|nr:hypothetical protein [Roseisolibacter sp. H3M3-2]MDF1506473.1 hypothetical protein [Roseisolibacter sp. H3M3-2]